MLSGYEYQMKNHATVEKYGAKTSELSQLSLLKNMVLMAILANYDQRSKIFNFQPLNVIFQLIAPIIIALTVSFQSNRLFKSQTIATSSPIAQALFLASPLLSLLLTNSIHASGLSSLFLCALF